MKILYVCHRIPYPPNKGDKIRSFNEVKYLAEKYELDLLCLADEPGDLKYQADLGKICSRVAVFHLNKTVAKIRGLGTLTLGKSISVGYFYLKEAQVLFDNWVVERKYDAVICFSSSMAEYVFRSTTLKIGAAETPKLVMDFCDVDSDKWLQYAGEANFPLSWIYRLENRRLADYEIKINRVFDNSILISQKEAELFSEVCADARNVVIVPNGVDSDFFTPNVSEVGDQCCSATDPINAPDDSLKHSSRGASLVFTGAMDYHANIDGVCWFCQEIWPRLKQSLPDLNFYIVGSNPATAVMELEKLDGVTVTGFVDDIRDYYRMADVCVIPLRLARGVQNKVLESMSMGKAVVTTSRANAGIQAEDGDHLLVADTVESFVAAIRQLLEDETKRNQLGTLAREFVLTKYAWPSNMAKFDTLLS